MSTDDEVIIEPEDEAEATPAALTKLREKLKVCVAEKQEYLDGWQRARAEFANYRRQEADQEKEKEGRIKAKMFEELLPALDAFEQALKHLAVSNAPDILTGFKAVDKEWVNSLGRLGIERINNGLMDGGGKVNLYEYEVMLEEPNQNAQYDQTVHNIYRSGYKIGNHIIRPVQVSVYVYKKD